MVTTTDGHLLGGRVVYSQPSTGFRSGIEPVLLAASVPARRGEHVLEAGSGAGAALLCLSARVPGVQATGVEIDQSAAALAASNALANGFTNIAVIADRIEAVAVPEPCDHAIANPPYHPAEGSASPVAERDLAKRGSNQLMQTWIGWLSGTLRRRGSLTLIVPAGVVPVCLIAMNQSACPCTVLFPLWPKAGRPAKLVLLRGIKGGLTPMRIMPGLVLHQPDGSFTEAAQLILTGGGALSLEG